MKFWPSERRKREKRKNFPYRINSAHLFMYPGMNVFTQQPFILNTYYVLHIVLGIRNPKLEENNPKSLSSQNLQSCGKAKHT